MVCRHSKKELDLEFVDLGFQPPSNSYLSKDDLSKPEITFPLRVRVSSFSWLVQTVDFASEKLFFNENYAYFSSVSNTWLKHAQNYFNLIRERLKLSKDSFVVELASNDGYLLKHFKNSSIKCLGIEPTRSTAKIAKKLGINVVEDFFTEKLSNNIKISHGKADLIVANNVYAHVPDINDFTIGIKNLLAKSGTVNIEFPHLLKLLKFNQFDTIYHEHFSYLSLTSVIKIFNHFELDIYDVEEINTHGGSLRIYGCHKGALKVNRDNINKIIKDEKEYGLNDHLVYKNFMKKVNKIKDDLLSFLIDAKNKGKTVVAYGAAAKGNTLLNYAGIRSDLISYVFDYSPSKINKYLPGSHIEIKHPEFMRKIKPDYVLILPWNISDEIINQEIELKKSGTRFYRAIPELQEIN